MNTAEFLTISSAIVPDRTALADQNNHIAYFELQSNVNKLANAFQDLGVSKGANVGVMAVNSPDFVEIYYAAATVGATLVPLNFRAKTEEITHMDNEADIATLFIAERYWSIYEEVKDSIDGVENVIGIDFTPPECESISDIRSGAEDIPVFVDIDDGDPTLLNYTSGTTSLPKGVVLSYQALTALVVNTQSPADPTVDQ